ncbi:MAG: asparagine--tRNA ligase [bacterium]
MVEKVLNNVDKIFSERTYPETKKLIEEINKTDNNMPPVIKVVPKLTSFGNRIRIANLVASDAEVFIGKSITVAGWVKQIRTQKELIFVKLNDGSSFKDLQVVIDKCIPEFDRLSANGVGTSLRLTGVIVKSEKSEQLVEMQISDVEKHKLAVVGECNPSEYVLHKSKPNLETLREICHLRPRTNSISCVARIRNSLAFATHQFFQQRGFLYVHTPIVTGSDCEGAGEMFQVTTVLPHPKENVSKVPITKEGLVDYSKDFFKKPAFLTVSGQLAVENYACALSDVYTFGPTFRAENSHTTRHLAEFWMIEPEMCFADIYDDMECGENYLKYCLKWVLENNRDDLEFFDSFVEKGLIERLKNVVENSFQKITYTECIEILKEAVLKDKKLFAEEKKKEKKEKKEKKDKEAKKEGEQVEKKEGEVDEQQEKKEEIKHEEKKEVKQEEKKEDKRNIYWGMDMFSEHERYLTEVVFKKPIIVYNYPKEIKSFYMRENEDQKTVAAMDILVPKIGEIIGGSQREERHDVLLKKITDKGLDKEGYWWYLELRKYGSVPHAGFGLGFERLVMMATGLENIRDVIPYPRYPEHAEF